MCARNLRVCVRLGHVRPCVFFCLLKVCRRPCANRRAYGNDFLNLLDEFFDTWTVAKNCNVPDKESDLEIAFSRYHMQSLKKKASEVNEQAARRGRERKGLLRIIKRRGFSHLWLPCCLAFPITLRFPVLYQGLFIAGINTSSFF